MIFNIQQGESRLNGNNKKAACTANEKNAAKLVVLCWFAYAFAYLGRLNYAACLVAIVKEEGWTKGEAGLIATAFFITYGIGQLVNGLIGDRLAPKYMISLGLGFSGVVNLCFSMMHQVPAMLLLWCINGFMQSMLWSPLIRLLSERIPEEKRMRACINLNSSIPVGTLTVYGISALLVYLGSWRWVFMLNGSLLVLMAIFFYLQVSGLEQKLKKAEPVAVSSEKTVVIQKSMGKLVLAAAIPVIMLALVMQGALKDGVTTWIPTFLEEQFGLVSAAAILSTTLVPIINLSGVYLASWVDNKFIKNEAVTGILFFLVGFTALCLLTFLPHQSAVLSLMLLAVTTTFMVGVNTLYTCMMPTYFVSFGKCSTITGLLNSSAYIGCAVSSYGSGAVAEAFGWHTIMVCWCGCALLGIVFCLLAAKRWGKFRKLTLEDGEIPV